MNQSTSSVVMASPEYQRFIENLKAWVVSARISATRAVNRELILLYWDSGCAIVEKQQMLGWGESVVEMVSADLRRAFPGTTGFSARNLRDMKRFYLSYVDESQSGTPERQFLRQLVAEIPWGH